VIVNAHILIQGFNQGANDVHCLGKVKRTLGAICTEEEAGVTFRSELKDQPWGYREVEIEDFQGNRIVFYGDIN
jgi:hypothetical protein